MEAVAEPADKAVHYPVKYTVNFKFSGDSGINLINLNYLAATIKVNSQYIYWVTMRSAVQYMPQVNLLSMVTNNRFT